MDWPAQRKFEDAYASSRSGSQRRIDSLVDFCMKEYSYYKHYIGIIEKSTRNMKQKYRLPCVFVIDGLMRSSSRKHGSKDAIAPRLESRIVKMMSNLVYVTPSQIDKLTRIVNGWNRYFNKSIMRELTQILENQVDAGCVVEEEDDNNHSSPVQSVKSPSSIDNTITDNLSDAEKSLLMSIGGIYTPVDHTIDDPTRKRRLEDNLDHSSKRSRYSNPDVSGYDNMNPGLNTNSNPPYNAEYNYPSYNSNNTNTNASSYHYDPYQPPASDPSQNTYPQQPVESSYSTNDPYYSGPNNTYNNQYNEYPPYNSTNSTNQYDSTNQYSTYNSQYNSYNNSAGYTADSSSSTQPSAQHTQQNYNSYDSHYNASSTFNNTSTYDNSNHPFPVYQPPPGAMFRCPGFVIPVSNVPTLITPPHRPHLPPQQLILSCSLWMGFGEHSFDDATIKNIMSTFGQVLGSSNKRQHCFVRMGDRESANRAKMTFNTMGIDKYTKQLAELNPENPNVVAVKVNWSKGGGRPEMYDNNFNFFTGASFVALEDLNNAFLEPVSDNIVQKAISSLTQDSGYKPNINKPYKDNNNNNYQNQNPQHNNNNYNNPTYNYNNPNPGNSSNYNHPPPGNNSNYNNPNPGNNSNYNNNHNYNSVDASNNNPSQNYNHSSFNNNPTQNYSNPSNDNSSPNTNHHYTSNNTQHNYGYPNQYNQYPSEYNNAPASDASLNASLPHDNPTDPSSSHTNSNDNYNYVQGSDTVASQNLPSVNPDFTNQNVLSHPTSFPGQDHHYSSTQEHDPNVNNNSHQPPNQQYDNQPHNVTESNSQYSYESQSYNPTDNQPPSVNSST